MEEQVTSLPAGPGMGRRWLYAVPMMVVSTFAPWLGQLVILVLWRSPVEDILKDIGEPEPTFWQEFGELFRNGWYGVWVPAVVLLWFLLTRSRIAPWPAACVVVGVLSMLPIILTLTGDFAEALPNIAFALALLWLSWELGRQAVKVLTRPIARDLVTSKLEIPYRLPGGPQRLRIQQNKVVIDRLRGNKQDLKRRTIMLGQAKEAQLVEVESKRTWQPNKHDTIVVDPGLAIRIEGNNQKWLIPVTEDDGPPLVTAINRRRRS